MNDSALTRNSSDALLAQFVQDVEQAGEKGFNLPAGVVASIGDEPLALGNELGAFFPPPGRNVLGNWM